MRPGDQEGRARPAHPWEQEVGEKATPGHRAPYHLGAPPLINMGEPESWIPTRPAGSSSQRAASQGAGLSPLQEHSLT